MIKKKKIIIAASSFLCICLFVCGFAIFSGKKAPSDHALVESVTFDSNSAATDPDTPHTYTQSAANGESDRSDAIDESVTTDPVNGEVMISPADDASEDDSLPSHSFSSGTP